MRPAVGHEAARRERHRVIRHLAFSTRRNFLPTYIRQRQCFSVLGRANEPSLATVTSAVVAEASLVASAGRAMIRGQPKHATPGAAVLLPAVVATTDEERHDAPEARQLVDCNDRVQGSGCDRQKLGRNPRSVRQYDLSKARLWVYGRRLEGLARAFTLLVRPGSSCLHPSWATSSQQVTCTAPLAPGGPRTPAALAFVLHVRPRR